MVIAIFISGYAILFFGYRLIRNLESLLDRIDNCCSESVGLIRPDGSEFEVPVTCNNRSCDNPDCEVHRGSLHERNHFAQLEYCKEFIENPKSFVFTGWRLYGMSAEEVREFSQHKLSRLYFILNSINNQLINQGRKPSPFCVYEEFKIYSDGSLYVHYHVVSGTIGDIHHAQGLWGRIVRYEYPIVSEIRLIRYIRKYTGKTPVVYGDSKSDKAPLSAFPDIRLFYIFVTYKLQMCRYSERRQICIDLYGKREPRAFLYAQVVSDFYSTLRSSRGRNEFVPYIDRPPPLESDDVPSCVYVFPTEPVARSVVNSFSPVLPKKKCRGRHSSGSLKVSRDVKNEHYVVDESGLNRSIRKTWRRNSEAFFERLKNSCLEQFGGDSV